MSEEELPVFGTNTGSEYAEHLKSGAEDKDGAEVAGVCKAACEGSYEEDEEDLNGADPGDGRGWEIEGGRVVGLKQAE